MQQQQSKALPRGRAAETDGRQEAAGHQEGGRTGMRTAAARSEDPPPAEPQQVDPRAVDLGERRRGEGGSGGGRDGGRGRRAGGRGRRRADGADVGRAMGERGQVPRDGRGWTRMGQPQLWRWRAADGR